MADPPLFDVDGLSVRAPGGDAILDRVCLAVAAGEAVVIVGPSGAGKSTLLRALFDRPAMLDEGFAVSADGIAARGSIGLVPQRGAVFDHLDVAGNIAIALRHAETPTPSNSAQVSQWLRAVDLDEQWAVSHRAVGHLSGGQAQRLAVARVLASGRRVLFLDEPSVGLDPLRVKALAWQLRRVCDQNAAGLVVVTHDAHFAAAFADRVLLLRERTLVPLALTARESSGCRRGPGLALAQQQLDGALLEALASVPANDESATPRGPGVRPFRFLARQIRPFGVLVEAPIAALSSLVRHPRDFFHILFYTLRQSLARPLAFYAIVSFLLGYTLLYVLASVGGEFGAAASIRLVRGLYVVALTPPLSAFLFVAASANAVNAWLGGMRLSRQIAALEALGIPRTGYLWGPAFVALAISYLAVAGVFALGLLVGGYVLCTVEHVPASWDLLTADLIDPVPERAPYVVRAAVLIVLYAFGLASDAIARADQPKERADDVTRSMTASVIASTLWVVALELASLVVLRVHRGGA